MKNKVWLLFPVLVMIMGSCGYRFTGGGDFPFNIKTVFVPVFENRTAETGIETILTNDFIYELTRSRKVNVVEQEMADAVLLGVITSLNTQTIARSGLQVPLERIVRIFIDMKLTDRHGKVLWAMQGISDDETYEVSADKFSTEQRKRIAIKTLSGRMAEMVHYQLTDME